MGDCARLRGCVGRVGAELGAVVLILDAAEGQVGLVLADRSSPSLAG